ncbi:ATP-binding protein [Alteromonas flava]|uniref:GAF domain-containing sensor histidine kinase n=1 Tax=Alteromonas flava TaxID=2048003 RepID=UPI000C287343|nr:ATP-binding protein [Alteromonas flava]
MQKPLPTKNESERLKALDSYRVMDSPPEAALDDITNMAAELCDVPIALISLVDDHRQWFKSACGLGAKETDKDIAFCAHAIHQQQIFEVPNALEDPRFFDNPLVTGEPNIRFYAGMPLITSAGYALGTLCVIDTKPNQLSEKQRRYLKVLAQEVIARFELQKSNQALQRAQKLQLLITETNQDCIFVKDKDCKIIQANSAFMALYPDDKRAKVIGYTTVEDYHPKEAELFLADDKQALESGKVEKFETITCPDGVTRTLFTTKVRFKDDDGEPYILGVARDVTEREALIKSLEKSNQDLDEFAYVASHDLRAPLTAIRRLIEWVREDALGHVSDETIKQIDMIEQRSRRMDQLLTDLLNYAKVGREQHEPEQIDLCPFVEDIVALIDKPEGFAIKAEPAILNIPRTPLQLVLTNLLSNALKHHDKAIGMVSVSVVESATHYAISVADDGPGIAPEYREQVFEKFKKLRSQDDVAGSGLGLSMVLKMIEHYAGTIHIEDNLPRGSQFIIEWPKP